MYVDRCTELRILRVPASLNPAQIIPPKVFSVRAGSGNVGAMRNLRVVRSAIVFVHLHITASLVYASHDKFGNSRSSTRRSRRYDAGSEDRTHRSSSKPRPPPESYLSTKWIHSALSSVLCVAS